MNAINIRKLSATTSTNTELKQALAEDPTMPPTVLWAEYQSEGKGQYQRQWKSEAGKNLTFSLYWPHNQVTTDAIFLVNQVVCLALMECLRFFKLPEICIKWPNDILSGTSKLAGVLIENIFYGDRCKASIIGIGLNVNQMSFYPLVQASSMALILGKQIDRVLVLNQCLTLLEKHLETLNPSCFKSIAHDYSRALFGFKKWTTVRHQNIEQSVKVKAVASNGAIFLELESGETVEISDSKELQWLY